MSSSGKNYLGLDIGGTEIKAVALQLPDKIIKVVDIPSNAKISPEAVRKAIRDCVSIFEKAGISYSSVGMGCAGSVEPVTGVVRNSPNFAQWSNVPLKEWISQDLNCPVEVHNDANCAAFSEWKMGNGAGSKNMVLYTFGTGVGGGLILNNKLFVGSTGSAGELGHFSIYTNGIECPCGNFGCFERYCSASALQQKLPGYTAKQIFEREYESPFKEVVVQFIHDVKVAITSAANVFDPDCMLLGGAVSNGLAPHLKDIESWVKARAFPAVAKNVRLSMTKFGNQSGALGAALLSSGEP